jgi:hypothetical protein
VTEAVIAEVIVDAAVSDAVAGAGAVVAAVKARPRADAIFRRRSTLRRKAISAATIRAVTAIATIVTTAEAKGIAVTTIAVTVADHATTIAGRKVAHGRRLHRNRAAKKKFCCRASRSRSIAVAPRPRRPWRRSRSRNRTTSRNRISMNPSRAVRDHSRTFLAGPPVCLAGYSPAAQSPRAERNPQKVQSKSRIP